MANPVCDVLLTELPLQRSPPVEGGSGAIVEFYGVVRPLEQEREITGIEYEAHSLMAVHQINKLAEEATASFHLHSALIHHRIGFVPAGEASVLVRTTSRNRRECYQANEWIMEQLKARVPIWKRPEFKRPDGIRQSRAESLSSR
jgi:molybdopterin synthase catalytic subunit